MKIYFIERKDLMKNLKFKKFLSLFLVFAIIGGILGGCGKKMPQKKMRKQKMFLQKKKLLQKMRLEVT